MKKGKLQNIVKEYDKSKLIELFKKKLVFSPEIITDVYNEEYRKYWDPYRPMPGYEEWTILKAFHSAKKILSEKYSLPINNICGDDDSHICVWGECACGIEIKNKNIKK